MGVVRNLMVRCGADFSALTKSTAKAKTSMSGLQRSVNANTKAINSSFASIKKAAGIALAAFSVAKIAAFAKESESMYKEQLVNEAKLAVIMKTRMQATNKGVSSLLDFMRAEEKLGVVSAATMTAGAQELGTYLSEAESMKTLIPVLNNIATQQYGVEVSAGQLSSAATMLGKVMDGQLGGLSKWGYSWTEAQEHILNTGTEMERAAVIADVITSSVGNMNYALAGTDVGRQRQMANAFENIQTQVGEAVNKIKVLLLPVLEMLANAFAKVASFINMVADALTSLFGSKGAKSTAAVANTLGTGAANAEDLADGIEDAQKAAKGATASFDKLNVLTQPTETEAPATPSNPLIGLSDTSVVDNFADNAASAGEALADRIRKAFNSLNKIKFNGLKASMDKFTASATTSLEKIKKTASSSWESIKSSSDKAWRGMVAAVEPLITPIGNIAIDAGRVFTTYFADGISATTSILGSAVSGAVSIAGAKIETAAAAIQPAVTSLASFFAENGEEIERRSGEVWENIKNAATGAVEAYTSHVTNVYGGFTAWFRDNSESMETAWSGTWAAIWSVVDGIWTGIETLADSIFGGIADFFKENSDGIRDALVGTWNTIWTIISPIWNTISSVVTTVFGGIKDFFQSNGETIKGIFKGVFELIWTIVSTVLDKVKAFWDVWGDTIMTAIRGVMEHIKIVFETAWNIIKTTFETVLNVIKGIIDFFIAVFKGDWEGAWEAIKNVFNSIWEGMKKNLSNVIDGMKKIFNNFGDTVLNVWESIKKGFKGMVNFVIRGMNSMIEGVLVPFNFIIDGLNLIPNVNIPRLSLKIPEIPALAAGGVVSGSTLAQIGEAGQEAVLPLENNTGWMDILAEKIALRGEVTFNGPPDIMQLVRLLDPSFTALDKIKGKNLIIGGV